MIRSRLSTSLAGRFASEEPVAVANKGASGRLAEVPFVRTLARLVVASIIIGGALNLFAPEPAAAYTTSKGGLCPGGMGWNPVVGQQAGNMQVYPGQWTVSRAPCFVGIQYVTVKFQAYGFNLTSGQWQKDRFVQSSTVLAANQTFGTVSFNWFNPYYRRTSVDATIYWKTSAGQSLGWRYVDYNAPSDYRCASTNTALCRVYSDPTVGAFFYFPPLY